MNDIPWEVCYALGAVCLAYFINDVIVLVGLLWRLF